MNDQESIKVGNCTMIATTVRVTLLLDFLDNENMPAEKSCEHFRLIETDGYFIVSVESFFHFKPSEIAYKCFIMREDADSYLTLHGVEIADKEGHEDRESSHTGSYPDNW